MLAIDICYIVISYSQSSYLNTQWQNPITIQPCTIKTQYITLKEKDQPISVLKHVSDRYDKTMTNSHFQPIYYILDIEDVCVKETDKVLEHILKRYPDLMASRVNYKAKTGPFHQYMFVPEKMNLVSPITWWHSQSE